MIGYDDYGLLTRFARRQKIDLTLLSDKDSRLIKAFDVLDNSVAESAPWYGLARPIIFVIDPKGVITHRFSNIDYQTPPEPDDVLNALR